MGTHAYSLGTSNVSSCVGPSPLWGWPIFHASRPPLPGPRQTACPLTHPTPHLVMSGHYVPPKSPPQRDTPGSCNHEKTSGDIKSTQNKIVQNTCCWRHYSWNRSKPKKGAGHTARTNDTAAITYYLPCILHAVYPPLITCCRAPPKKHCSQRNDEDDCQQPLLFVVCHHHHHHHHTIIIIVKLQQQKNRKRKSTKEELGPNEDLRAEEKPLGGKPAKHRHSTTTVQVRLLERNKTESLPADKGVNNKYMLDMG